MRFLTFLCAFLSLTGASAIAAEQQRVLFVGNSYLLDNDGVHTHVAAMSDPTIETMSHSTRDAFLHEHDIGPPFEQNSFDLVILQGHSTEMTTPEKRAQFQASAARLAETIGSRGARIALYMTPAYTPSHPNYDPEMFERVAQGYREEAAAIGAGVIPVGLAFEMAYEARPEMPLHMPDGSHPTRLGSYLGAATVRAAMFGPTDMPDSYLMDGAVSPEDAVFLHDIAMRAVTAICAPTLGQSDQDAYVREHSQAGGPIC